MAKVNFEQPSTPAKAKGRARVTAWSQPSGNRCLRKSTGGTGHCSSTHRPTPPPRTGSGGWAQGPESRQGHQTLPARGLGVLFAAGETGSGGHFQRFTAHSRLVGRTVRFRGTGACEQHHAHVHTHQRTASSLVRHVDTCTPEAQPCTSQ